MLHKMALRNFKGWRSVELDLAPITLLFGTNSSGKTAILHALLMLKQTVNSRDPNTHLNFGGGPRDYVDLGSYRDLVTSRDEEKRLGLSLDWKTAGAMGDYLRERLLDSNGEHKFDNCKSLSFCYEVCWSAENDIVVDALGYRLAIDACETLPDFCAKASRRKENEYELLVSDSMFKDNSNKSGTDGCESYAPFESVGEPGSCYMLQYAVAPAAVEERLRFAPHYFSFEFNGLMDRIHYLGPLRDYPKRLYIWTGEKKSTTAEPDGADAMAALISSLRGDGTLYEQVGASLRDLGLVDAFALRPVDQQGRLYEPLVALNGQTSALLDVGFGVSQVLPVLTLLFSAPAGSILLLEQPELHLHPSAQAALADLILHVAATRNLQLIVETHSEHLLRRLQRRVAERETDFATHENIKAYFCNPSPEGLIAEEVLVDRFGQISNWPHNFFGDIAGDIHNMAKAALTRHGLEQELAEHRG